MVSEKLNLVALAAEMCREFKHRGRSGFFPFTRGTTLTFAGGVVLMVEEYNPPCSRMSHLLPSNTQRAMVTRWLTRTLLRRQSSAEAW